MQFNSQKSFGYPVLRPGSTDYASGAFQPTIIPQDVAKGEDTVNLSCRFVVSIEAIVSLIQEKRAAFVLIVDCRDTFYREPYETFDKRADFTCNANNLKGRITLETYIIAKEGISDFHCPYIDDFFGPGPHEFSEGMVLAQGIPIEKNIHAEKLRDNRSLLTFSSDAELKLGEWWFDILSEFPSVYVSPKQLAWINSAPVSSNPVIENTFLVPIVSEMISAMRDDELSEQVAIYPWSKIIEDGLSEAGHRLSDFPENNIRLAQAFLSHPLARQNPILVGGAGT